MLLLEFNVPRKVKHLDFSPKLPVRLRRLAQLHKTVLPKQDYILLPQPYTNHSKKHLPQPRPIFVQQHFRNRWIGGEDISGLD
jgi:hypothetical protein